MLIGVPAEIKNHEYRVGMTPQSIREVTHHGHEALVESNAGAGIGLHQGLVTVMGHFTNALRRHADTVFVVFDLCGHTNQHDDSSW